MWAKLPKSSKDHHPADHEVQRNNVRIKIEKIAHKADPVKVYRWQAPASSSTVHSKCTVTLRRTLLVGLSTGSGSFRHVDHKTEVVYIDKDHLRRALPTPVAATDAVDGGPT